MQKNNKKASILLWSIFMSLLIGALFITASIEIQKTLEENDNFLTTQKSTRKLEKYLAENKKETWYALGEGEFLKMDSKNIYKTGMKQNESFEFTYKNISIPPKNNTIKIEVGEGVLQYEYSSKIKTIRNSTIIENIGNGSKIKISCLSGYAKLKISSNEPINFPKRYYQVIKKIAHKEVVTTSGFIEN